MMRFVVMLILSVMTLVPATGATGISNSTLGYQPEMLNNAYEVRITLNGILSVKATKPAMGDGQDSPVTMSSGNDETRTALTKGNWAYRAMISIIDGITPINTTYKVELERNGTPVSTLYIKHCPKSRLPRQSNIRSRHEHAQPRRITHGQSYGRITT